MRINPFSPTSPITPGMFIGRLNELNRLETHLLQTKHGNPSNFMITGERGIGKSSLLLFLKAVAEGGIAIGNEGDKVKFLVVDTDIDPSTTQIGLLKKIELGFTTALAKSEQTRKFFSDVWGFVRRFEVGGVKLRDKADVADADTVIEEFSYSLADTAARLCGPKDSESIFDTKYDGIVILIDEADNGSRELSLGSFLKLMLERLQRRGCNNVMIGLAGLPTLRDVLSTSHHSSLRLFEEILLDRLSDDEVDDVIEVCLKRSSETNSRETRISAAASEALRHLSEGYPHFIQQFGFSAFAQDDDFNIDEMDVHKGAFDNRGALDIIGDRYYRNDFYNRIQKDSYRQVLRIMSKNLDGWVKKDEIRKVFKGSHTVLDSAIKALRERHIIIPKEGERGVYRLQHKGFAYWITLRTAGKDELDELVRWS